MNGASFESAITAGIQQPTSFVLETEELLREVRLDHEKAFEGADDLLHRLKGSIEAIEPHGPIPVNNIRNLSLEVLGLTCSRSQKQPRNSRKPTE